MGLDGLLQVAPKKESARQGELHIFEVLNAHPRNRAEHDYDYACNLIAVRKTLQLKRKHCDDTR